MLSTDKTPSTSLLYEISSLIRLIINLGKTDNSEFLDEYNLIMKKSMNQFNTNNLTIINDITIMFTSMHLTRFVKDNLTIDANVNNIMQNVLFRSKNCMCPDEVAFKCFDF